MEDYTIVWNALIASSVSALAEYTCVLKDANGEYLPSTAANRAATGRKSAGIARTAADSITRTFNFQFVGLIPKDKVPTVGAGAQGQTVYVNANGNLARGGVQGVDDIVGVADDLGNVSVLFGGLGAAGGTPGPQGPAGPQGEQGPAGDDGATGPMPTVGGTGYPFITGGAWPANASAVNLAGGANHVSGILPRNLGGTGVDFSNLTGQALKVVRVNAGENALELATAGAAGAPVGASYLTLATDGTLTSERVLTAGTGISFVDGGAGSTLTVSTTCTPGGSGAQVQYRNTATTFGGMSGWSASSGNLLGTTTSWISWGGATNGLLRIPSGGSRDILVVDDGGGGNRAPIINVNTTTGLNTFGMASFNTTLDGGSVSIAAGGTQYIGVGSNVIDLRPNATSRLYLTTTNASFFSSSPSFGTTGLGGAVSNCIYIANTSAPPGTAACGTAPSGGGVLFSEAGAGSWKGTSGTKTVFGPADPHCEKCGRDFGHEWENPHYDERVMLCIVCMLGALERVGVDVASFSERRLAT